MVELENSRFVEQVHGDREMPEKHGTNDANGGDGPPKHGDSRGDPSGESWEGITYRFHHPLVQQTLYNLTPIRDRRKVRMR